MKIQHVIRLLEHNVSPRYFHSYVNGSGVYQVENYQEGFYPQFSHDFPKYFDTEGEVDEALEIICKFGYRVIVEKVYL